MRDYVPPCVDGDLINFYYWDTYFTNLGLIEDGETDLALGNIEDLIFCLYKFGCVPNMCRGNGATYASQPPLLFLMTKDFYVHTGDRDFLIKGYDALSLEYSFWTEKTFVAVRTQSLRLEFRLFGGRSRFNRIFPPHETRFQRFAE